MKFLFDLLPIIFFFGTFKYAESHTDVAVSFATQLLGSGITAEMAPILLSTAVAILASLVQLIYLIVMRRKIETMFWISVAVIVIFGGMTLYFRDGAFIKWKPTILYWTFAAILLWGECTGRNFMKKMLEKAEMNLPESAWQTLQRAWIGFFIAMGVINLLVAYLFSTDTWVNFKLFGLMGLTIVFTIGIGFLSQKQVQIGKIEPNRRRKKPIFIWVARKNNSPRVFFS